MSPDRLVRGVLVVLAGAGLVAGIFLLREATISRGEEVDPASRLEVVVSASTRQGEPTQTIDERVEAVLLTCRLETGSDYVDGVEPMGTDRWRVVMQPSMGRTDRRQFTGCVEDWLIDGVLVDVESMAELP